MTKRKPQRAVLYPLSNQINPFFVTSMYVTR